MCQLAIITFIAIFSGKTIFPVLFWVKKSILGMGSILLNRPFCGLFLNYLYQSKVLITAFLSKLKTVTKTKFHGVKASFK